MNDAEQMVHCYILKVGSMILHTLPFKEVVHNYYNLVELHNTVIVVTNVNYYTYSKVEYQMFYFLSSEYFFLQNSFLPSLAHEVCKIFDLQFAK